MSNISAGCSLSSLTLQDAWGGLDAQVGITLVLRACHVADASHKLVLQYCVGSRTVMSFCVCGQNHTRGGRIK
jgi:hypothetical protein